LFGTGVAAVDRFPEGDNPGSIEFVGEKDFTDRHEMNLLNPDSVAGGENVTRGQKNVGEDEPVLD
jgi:hypothetical protein